jgi:hypothetical protein
MLSACIDVRWSESCCRRITDIGLLTLFTPTLLNSVSGYRVPGQRSADAELLG